MKILRQHLLEGKAVSDLCEYYKISPSLFYQWQRSLFENDARAFEGSGQVSGQSKVEKELEAVMDRHALTVPIDLIGTVNWKIRARLRNILQGSFSIVPNGMDRIGYVD